jgi:dTDP-4-amino-4,6-dideoxygalactose transaminase
MYLADAALRRLPERNRRATRAWQWLCEELDGVGGIRTIATTPGGERGGFYAFVLEYTGEDLGGPDTEAFVAAVAAEGAPILFDQFRGRLLHTLALFRSLDRRKLGGGCFDPTRPWEENLSAGTRLPVSERLVDRLVAFPPQLYGVPEAFVRDCARAVKKVLAGLLPAAARERAGEPAGIPVRPVSAGAR